MHAKCCAYLCTDWREDVPEERWKRVEPRYDPDPIS